SVCVDFSTEERQTTGFAELWVFCRALSSGAREPDRWTCRVSRIHHFAMSEHRVSYTMDSTLETVDSAEQTASQIATDAGFDDDEVMKIAMAVREAAVNAVLHGNAYDPGKKVKMDFERNSRDLVITIRDQGKGLDPSKIPDPLAPENLLKTSGRG